MSRIGRLIRTLRHLKPTQIAHQVKYRLVPLSISKVPEPPKGFEMRAVAFDHTRIYGSNPWAGDVFRVLNRGRDFSSGVDWTFMGHGKLWQYNLQYFSHLPGVVDEAKDRELARLAEFHTALGSGKVALEPYPVSLRLIHSIRFRDRHEIRDPQFDRWIWRQGWYLRHRLEYHLLANHLLENAFALTLTGWACRESEWFETGLKLLTVQLTEQVLSDGAHYERSVMYHHILTYRVLEFLDWSSREADLRDSTEVTRIREISQKMIGWMNAMTTPDGTLARWADVAEGIAPNAEFLNSYAASLGLQAPSETRLGTSRYRVYRQGAVWCCFNAGAVEPAYQPGHAHADQLSFLLFVDGVEVVTDVGISTYEADAVRHLQRGSGSHNTIVVAEEDSAEVWGGFRVGRRPKMEILSESDHSIEARHDGYRHVGCAWVSRSMDVQPDLIRFEDRIAKDRPDWEVRIHIHPDRSVELIDGKASIDGLVIVNPEQGDISLEPYDWCEGYNKTKSATRIRIRPNGRELTWSIHCR